MAALVTRKISNSWKYFTLVLSTKKETTVAFIKGNLLQQWRFLLNRNLLSFLMTVEPRPYDSDLIKEPVYSVLGNPVPIRLACAFTGYPPPDVRIEMNGNVVAVGIESVWVEISTDSIDDYGVYYCAAENVVGPSKLNYTFEIRRSGL